MKNYRKTKAANCLYYSPEYQRRSTLKWVRQSRRSSSPPSYNRISCISQFLPPHDGNNHKVNEVTETHLAHGMVCVSVPTDSNSDLSALYLRWRRQFNRICSRPFWKASAAIILYTISLKINSRVLRSDQDKLGGVLHHLATRNIFVAHDIHSDA